MCAIVLVEDVDPAVPQWDHDRVAVVIGPGLDHFQALRQIRSLLLYLGAPQMGLGATCWCGEYIAVPGPEARVPRQHPVAGRREARNAG
ncbi:hypothetical protein ACFZBE_17785 [Streptomyces sp. NPDC008061]|uniref:hypothetical protein n=1 Tax=Streptomyces sp. NPDC008061 TaxID=3364805 RepID=UPI0036E3DD94